MKKHILSVALASTILLTGNALTAEASANTYTVHSGDTLWSISQKSNVSISNLLDWNNLSSSSIYVGQTLYIAKKATPSSMTYTVTSGDSLYSIAKNHHTSVDSIKKWNNLTSNTIYVGQTLKLSDVENKTNQQFHTVKAGDSLYAIASKYGTTVQNIKQINGLSSNTIYAGQKLQLSSSNLTQPAPNVVHSIIAEGKKYMGVPYVWGGTSPSGFDCSGFLNYVFSKNGISIPRTVETIWKAGKTVSSPSKGDLVFFETYKTGPSHAGIYLGNKQFLHASSSKGVTISSMDNSYWSARYLGAKKLH
ncbi:peptidoglycan endopeptidase [Oceanobacillus halophilus]|uniref:Peptidoglycan endopeptidase n=1 Tax=Oceanobacillus halophilus TaxID=930130 RepID=A0A495A7Z3_9BACI|nr:C40 family peptidase [Oceanobacillus halophilus]RKQ35912.1 peptidoglycan endopeptidase [Oceanobacillus halophilus]